MDNMESKIIRSLSNPYVATKAMDELDQYKKLGTWNLKKDPKFRMRDALVYCLAASGQSLMTLAARAKISKQVAFKATQKVKWSPMRYADAMKNIYTFIESK